MLKFDTNTRHFDKPQLLPIDPLDLGQVLKLSAREKARLANDWRAGRIALRLTIRNASRIFRTSAPYIIAAEKGTDRPAVPSRTLASAWARASDSERAEFARATAEVMWGILDEATAPPVVVPAPYRNGHETPHIVLLG